MEPRITIVTLGVDDLERSLAFYREGLGLPSPGIVGQEFEHGAVAFFELHGGLRTRGRRGLGERRVLAAAITLLDSGVLRVGGEEYAETNGSHGVATLLCSHVRVRGEMISLER